MALTPLLNHALGPGLNRVGRAEVSVVMRLRIAIVLIMGCGVVAGWASGRAAVDRAAGSAHITRPAARLL